jgi:hypothetical protein
MTDMRSLLLFVAEYPEHQRAVQSNERHVYGDQTDFA